MLSSHYIPGVSLPSFDDAVSTVIKYELSGGGNRMVIAIENETGDVYRVLETVGMGAYMHTVHAILDLGFTDVLANSLHGKDGYDSRMIPSAELLAAHTEHREETDSASEILRSMASLAEVSETERQALVRSRVGQGPFRDKLVKYWGKCAVSSASCVSLLRASHIKPWRDSTNDERLDPFNGLLLTPNLDSAFDSGHIAFDDDGRIVLSRRMLAGAAYQLHISPRMRIDKERLTAEHRRYLEYHRTSVYRDT